MGLLYSLLLIVATLYETKVSVYQVLEVKGTPKFT